MGTTAAITGEMVRDLMATSIEQRFGAGTVRTPHPIQWLSDNGPPYTAQETRAFGRDSGLLVCTTPAYSPESNGMAEAFVKTFKRDYTRVHPRTDAATVLAQLHSWFEHYNAVHPHKALNYRSPREFRTLMKHRATDHAVGALRRAHHSKMSMDVIESSPPAAHSAETRSV